MTDYERLSLALLTSIAQGIGFLLNSEPMLEEIEKHQAENVLKWQKNLDELIRIVTSAAQPEAPQQ